MTLFLSVVTDGWPRPLPCPMQPQHDCGSLLRELAGQARAEPPEQAADSRLPGANDPGRASPKPTSPGAVAIGPQVTRSAYVVKLQFAGAINRENETKPLAVALINTGWGIVGWQQGGERTPQAAGTAEVRYRDAADRPAAELLALEVQRNISLPQRVVAAQNKSIRPGELEIWISR